MQVNEAFDSIEKSFVINVYNVYEMISDLYLSQVLSVPYRRCLSPFAAAIYCSLSLGRPS